MPRPKPVLLAGATALSTPSAAGAASGPQIFRGTIVTDASGGERHRVATLTDALPGGHVR